MKSLTPNDIMNYWRCADTQEIREVLEAFQKKHPRVFLVLGDITQQYPFKRKPEAFLDYTEEQALKDISVVKESDKGTYTNEKNKTV